MSSLTVEIQTAINDALATAQGDVDTLWMVLGTVLVFWMHAGFSLVEAGSVRAKNVQNILFKNVMNVTITTVTWWLWGYSFAFGGSNTAGIIGGTDGDLYTVQFTGGSEMVFWLFQWAFAATAVTIISGGMAERANTVGYFMLVLVFNTIIYPVIVHWVWGGGWLSDHSFTDFAGSGVVHAVGGVAAFVGCFILGKRDGRIKAHSPSYICLGTFILWMGWFGFNGASGTISGASRVVVGMTLINTTIAASVSGITVVMFFKATKGRFPLPHLCNGILAGLVAITAPCANVEDWAAAAIGFVAAFFYILGVYIEDVMDIDDCVGAFPVHGMAGIWGILATGLFDLDNGWFYNSSTIMGWQCIGILCIVAWTCFWTAISLYAAKFMGILRISADAEEMGLDRYYHKNDESSA